MTCLLPLLLACVEYGLEDPDSQVQRSAAVTEYFNQESLSGLDLLFVVDATPSMAEEQGALAEAAKGLLTGLFGWQLSWQIGVVSMDLREEGRLRGRPWVITPSAADPEGALALALQVGSSGLPPSAGMEVALLALEPDNFANLGFRRPDAALHVVFVSDGDDQSAADVDARFLAWMQAEAEASGRRVVASAVVGDVPGGCEGEAGSATPGARYAAVAQSLGGAVQSVCAGSFSDVASQISLLGQEGSREFMLQAEPLAGSLRVFVDGERSSGWSLDGQRLIFEEAPVAGADIRVEYRIGEAG
jgi:hypothetical protein